ncbi:hypothetical protein [Actinokineospora sp. NBRC 105648]|uniref:hypothetical protein n=1 Tax=Actinokineospora sp. NBRC 105648 TaxID=3032206 RepID=UPI0025521BEF|nr:hypothetical protein [Actinokineospora sp. NBRC 105648]
MSMPAGWTLHTDGAVITRGRHPGWTADPSTLAADISGGLASTFLDVRAVDAGPAGAGAVRTLHVGTDRRGQGVAVESLLRPDGDGSEVACWLSPVGSYAADRALARRLLVGRPPLRRTNVSEASQGMRARLDVEVGPHTGSGLITRDGDTTWADLPGIGEPLWLPTSTLPAWLLAATGLGPRPHSPDDRVFVTTTEALDRLWTGKPTTPAETRLALAAEDLSDETCAELAAVAGGCVARWSLEWATTAWAGQLTVVDAGENGVWQVSSGVPEDLAAELGGNAVALRRTSSAELFHTLARLVAR